MRKVIIMIVSAALGVFGLVAGAGAALAAGGGTVITVANTPFGKALVVGSGKYKGFSLYDITSDFDHHFGCTTGATKTPVGPITCTGPSNDLNAEWPAITTNGAPIAGPGIQPSLLGSVSRKGVGRQVTYNGRPLYLFDKQPGAVTGEGWDEPSLPPWHGVWFLVRPNGNQLPWTSNLTTVKLHGRRYLATTMQTGVGWINFPVYKRASACPPGPCARVWPYMLTAGHPGTSHGAHAWAVGTHWTGLGKQVTYKGHPLYLFANEGLSPKTLRAAGNGNGVAGFSLVSP
jgi:predicted lipoprotein with Yx(FWY)xxD motif